MLASPSRGQSRLGMCFVRPALKLCPSLDSMGRFRLRRVEVAYVNHFDQKVSHTWPSLRSASLVNSLPVSSHFRAKRQSFMRFSRRNQARFMRRWWNLACWQKINEVFFTCFPPNLWLQSVAHKTAEKVKEVSIATANFFSERKSFLHAVSAVTVE